MKNIKFTILGIVALLFALTLNFRHVLDDYGVLNNKLHLEVLAQTNNTGAGSTTDGDGTTSNIKTGGAVTNNGSCTFSSSTEFTFSHAKVNEAKKALGAEASTSAIAKWLLSGKISGSYDGEESITSSGGLKISFSSSGSYNYTWIDCMGQTSTACTPVPPKNCNNN